MKVLIIEDEAPAVAKLERLIATHCPDIVISGRVNSINSAVDFLEHNNVDLIFMDVQLSDGLCFEIFRMVDFNAKVIITTAYDQYAIAAFKVDSLDYLLKPIDEREFIAAVEKCRKRFRIEPREDISKYLSQLGQDRFKKRFTIRIGDRIQIVDVRDILFFFSEEKLTFIITSDGKRHISDMTLDSIEDIVDPHKFFRITRGCIVSISSIQSVNRHLGGRLKIQLTQPINLEEPLMVSRQRVASFLKWIEGE